LLKVVAVLGVLMVALKMVNLEDQVEVVVQVQ
jgi:hypothetical protein